MGRPGTLCRLKTGKAFGAHTGLAETFNWLVRFVDNLTGDNTHIEVDRTNEDHPIIKLAAGVLDGLGGMCGAFAYDQATHTVSGGACAVGRRFFAVDGAQIGMTGHVSLHVWMGTSPEATIDNSDPFGAEPSENECIVPLYYINEDWSIGADYRGSPTVPAWE